MLLKDEFDNQPWSAKKMNPKRDPSKIIAKKIAATISIVDNPELFIVCSTMTCTMNCHPSSNSAAVMLPEPSASQKANNCSTCSGVMISGTLAKSAENSSWVSVPLL